MAYKKIKIKTCKDCLKCVMISMKCIEKSQDNNIVCKYICNGEYRVIGEYISPIKPMIPEWCPLMIREKINP